MSIEPFNIKCKVHNVNGSLRITIPSSFHKVNDIDVDDDICIVIHRIIKPNGSVKDLCKILYKD
jgi:hypothetical protein